MVLSPVIKTSHQAIKVSQIYYCQMSVGQKKLEPIKRGLPCLGNNAFFNEVLWVPLKAVFQPIKMSAKFQFMTVQPFQDTPGALESGDLTPAMDIFSGI
jgi:hypothetical protein